MFPAKAIPVTHPDIQGEVARVYKSGVHLLELGLSHIDKDNTYFPQVPARAVAMRCPCPQYQDITPSKAYNEARRRTEEMHKMEKGLQLQIMSVTGQDIMETALERRRRDATSSFPGFAPPQALKR